jgi:hypothetical protein
LGSREVAAKPCALSGRMRHVRVPED